MGLFTNDVRNRLNGTLAIENRWNQFWAAFKFWKKLILPATGIFYIAGWWLLCSDKVGFGATTSIFYFKFKADFWWKVSDQLKNYGNGYPLISDVCNGLAEAVSPAPYIIEFDRLNGSLEGLDTIINRYGTGIYWVHAGTVIAFFGAWFAAYAWASREARKQLEDKFIRGSLLFKPKVLTKLAQKQYGKGNLKIAKLGIGKFQENESFFVCGSPGKGKTVLYRYLLLKSQQAGQASICYCAKQDDFITTHHRQGIDAIYCPLDARSLRWSLRNDIKTLQDLDFLANTLAPVNQEAKEPMWSKAENTAVKALFRKVWVSTDQSNVEFGKLSKISHPDMSTFLKNTPGCEAAYNLISDSKSATAKSFYISIICDLAVLTLIEANDGDFSLREWLATGKNTIFLPCNAQLEATLAPIYALFFELMAVNHMAMERNPSRRIWAFLDELPQIARVNILPRYLNLGRDRGTCCVLGTQSLSLVDIRYGKDNREAMMNACSTHIYHCVNDNKNATELSENLGTEENEKAKQNLSTASAEQRDGVVVMTEIKKDLLVSADMIRNLKPLEVYVRVSGFGTAEMMKLPYVEYPMTTPAFVENPETSIEAYVETYKAHMLKLQEVAPEFAKGKIIEAVAEHETVDSPETEKKGFERDDQVTQMMLDRDDM